MAVFKQTFSVSWKRIFQLMNSFWDFRVSEMICYHCRPVCFWYVLGESTCTSMRGRSVFREHTQECNHLILWTVLILLFFLPSIYEILNNFMFSQFMPRGSSLSFLIQRGFLMQFCALDFRVPSFFFILFFLCRIYKDFAQLRVSTIW